MPAPNPGRRRALADAAITIAGRDGLHGLTHRALDREAGVPAGTASNYFATRDELIAALAARLIELQRQDMDGELGAPGGSRDAAVESITRSLVKAATVDRPRWIALFEVQGELRRRPELDALLAPLRASSERGTRDHHRARAMPIDPEAVPVLHGLYAGALQALLDLPPDAITPAAARPFARTMLYGVRAAR